MAKGVARLVDVLLMHRDVPVLTARYDRRTHRFNRIIDLHAVEHAPAATFGPNGAVSVKTLNRWWAARAIPRTRDGYARLVDSMAIDDATELLEPSRGLSLSDTYWMHAADEDVSWLDVNYFQNPYDDELSVMTLGESSARRRHELHGSPSSSVSGDLKKAWIITDDGTRTLLKAGRGLAAQEVYNELCATRLYGLVMPPDGFVPYSIARRNGKVYSGCPDMLSGDADLVSAADLVFARKRRGDTSDYEWCVSALEVACPTDEVELKLDRMLGEGDSRRPPAPRVRYRPRFRGPRGVPRGRRRELGLTQGQLAKLCRCSPRFIGDFERGAAGGNIRQVLEVCHTLGIDLYARIRGRQ